MKNILILLLLAFSINAYALISTPNGYDPDKRSGGSCSHSKTECIGGYLFASKQKHALGGVALVQILKYGAGVGALREVRCKEDE